MASSVVNPDFQKGKNLDGIPATKQFRSSALSRARIMRFLNELFFHEDEQGYQHNLKIKKD